MTPIAGIVNVFMLMGLCLFVFKFLWSFVFVIVHAITRVIKRGRAVSLGMVVLLSGYFLASQTALILITAREALSDVGLWYEGIVSGLLILFVLFDRMGVIWNAQRRLDDQLVRIVAWQHILAGAMLVYALANIWWFPESGHLGLTRAAVSLGQRFLAVPFLGICLGVMGILYEIRMLMRVIKFMRIGPKGFPPFPKNVREL